MMIMIMVMIKVMVINYDDEYMMVQDVKPQKTFSKSSEVCVMHMESGIL